MSTPDRDLPHGACRARNGLLLALAALATTVSMPTQALVAGDVATVCWNSDNDDDFAVVALATIPAGTVFYLGDNGWSTATGTLMGEGQSSPGYTRQIQFTAGASGVPFGTVIEFDQAATTATLVNPALGTLSMVARFTPAQTNNSLSFGSAGDQLMVFQTSGAGASGALTMLSGFNGSAYSNPGIITLSSTGWQIGNLPQEFQTGGTSESNPPGPLLVYDGTNGSTATALGLAGLLVDGLTGQDNYRYTGPVGLATKAAWLASINNPANWDTNDLTPFSCTFGAGTSPEIAVSGNAQNIVDGDSIPSLLDHTDFGPADTVAGTVVRTFTIANSGSAALAISGVTFSGANPGDFSVTGAPASSVAPGATTTVQVTFNPSAVGLRGSVLTIQNNDADEAPFDFAIQGTGTQPEIAVNGNGQNIVDGDATPGLADHTDFGSANVAGGVATRTYTVSNAGNASLTLGTVLVGGAQAADFLVTQQPNGPLAPAATTTFIVAFGPGAAGLRNATLSFGNGDADENPFDFSIQGTGVVPVDPIFADGFETLLP